LGAVHERHAAQTRRGIAGANEFRDGTARGAIEIFRRAVKRSVVEHGQDRAFGSLSRGRTRLDGKIHPRSPSFASLYCYAGLAVTSLEASSRCAIVLEYRGKSQCSVSVSLKVLGFGSQP
jgi:hypothetical protein